MIHYMNLHHRPFLIISNGMKTIELRLLDEKRKMIAIGDTLIFRNASDSTATLSCVVKNFTVLLILKNCINHYH